MGMPLIQSITLIQMRRDVWNLVLSEAMGCSRVAPVMTSDITGKLTTTANKRREKVRRCMLTLDWAFPTATSLPNIMLPFRGFGGRVAKKFFAIFNNRKKTAPAGEPPPSNLFSVSLGVDSTLADSKRHPVNRQHVGSDAVVHMMGLGEVHHGFERLDHDVLQLFVDHGLFPEVTLAVLHPLEVGSGHTTRVGQDVGHHKHVLVGEDLVRHRGGRPIRTLH